VLFGMTATTVKLNVETRDRIRLASTAHRGTASASTRRRGRPRRGVRRVDRAPAFDLAQVRRAPRTIMDIG
jgi:hypothetical protein